MISAADRLVAQMASEIHDGAVVATGVASPLAVLAIAVARATHAPSLTYLACVGSLNPNVTRLLGSSEDLAYLEGRAAEITIPDLFDHARREIDGRIREGFFPVRHPPIMQPVRRNQPSRPSQVCNFGLQLRREHGRRMNEKI